MLILIIFGRLELRRQLYYPFDVHERDADAGWSIRPRGSTPIQDPEMNVKATSLDGADLHEIAHFSEDHLHLALEAAGVGLWYWDLKRNSLVWNDQCTALFGFARDDAVTYERFLAALHPDDRTRVNGVIQAIIHDGIEYNTEYRSVWPDESVHWLDARGRIRRDDSGKAVRMMGSVVDITERKLAEERAHESEHRWRRLMDSNIIGVTVADNHRFLDANRAFLDMMGFTRAEMEAGELSWYEQTPPEYRKVDDLALGQITANGACEPFEKEFSRKDGSRVPVLIGTVLLEKSPFRCLSFLLDLTERKRADAQISESEQRWRRLMGSNIIGIAVANDEGIIDANGLYLEMLGCTPAELKIGKLHWRDFTPPEYRQRDYTARAQVLSEGASKPYEKEYVRRDGTRLPVMVGASLLTAEPPSWIAFALDLTERKRAEALLHQSDRQLRAMTEGAPAYLFKTLPNLKLEYLTSYFYDFTGQQASNVSILPSDDSDLQLELLIHPDDLERVRNLWRDAATNLAHFNFEYRLRRADGVYRWFAARVHPELDGQGLLRCFYGAAFEIHTQKLAEDALREADRRKDEFLAMLAHELRNPLTPIANSVELLKIARPDDAELTRIGEMIGRQTTMLTRIVDDLLDVSRITTGKISLQKTPVDLGLVAQEAAEAVKPLVASRWQTLDIAASPATVQVLGRSDKIDAGSHQSAQQCSQVQPGTHRNQVEYRT